MVTITNGVDVIAVTNGAYENIYKRQGFRLYNPAAEPVAIEEPAEEGDVLIDLTEKPVSQWSNKEMALFVEVNGLEEQTKGLKGTKLKSFIKEFMECAEEPSEEDWDTIESEGE